MLNKQENKLLIIIGSVLWFVAVFILTPVLSYGVGWSFGVFAQLFVGEYIIEGLSYLNIIIPQDRIPEICGTLTVFGWCICGRENVISGKDVIDIKK